MFCFFFQSYRLRSLSSDIMKISGMINTTIKRGRIHDMVNMVELTKAQETFVGLVVRCNHPATTTKFPTQYTSNRLLAIDDTTTLAIVYYCVRICIQEFSSFVSVAPAKYMHYEVITNTNAKFTKFNETRKLLARSWPPSWIAKISMYKLLRHYAFCHCMYI